MTPTPQGPAVAESGHRDDVGLSLIDAARVLGGRLKLLLLAPLVVGALAFGATYLITPSFTARTTFLPPQQQQSAAATALASLGALSGLVGAAANIRTPAEQYVGLMRSATVTDHIIDRFELRQVYDEKFLYKTREELNDNVRIGVGKKDGLITVEVDDVSPPRAAAIANAFVEELRTLTGQLALTEAQQRRRFFEAQLEQTRDRLIAAQKALQASGFGASALKAEPKAAAEGYASLRAAVTAAEVSLQAMRRSLTDATPEVQRQSATAEGLRRQLARLEAASGEGARGGGDPDYVSKYREFKYQETLFDLFARQYELARVDESREGAVIQVVDVAAPPEWHSHPKRTLLSVGAAVVTLVILVLFVLTRHVWRLHRNAA